jgi:S-methylmethionine-dependent homocysteine/selenocysteine methylase
MSVTEVLSGRLAGGEVVIIDGGTGSQLQAEGVPMDDLAWSARANLEQPEVVQRVHEAYIRAGAEVIIANTFAASRAALTPAGLGDRVGDANRAAMRAAQRAREAAASGPVAVAGSMSSFSPIAMEATGSRPNGPGPEDPRFPGLADFREQARLLAEAGADLIALEMIGARGYGRAALQAATETGLPVWLGISPARREDGTVGILPDLGGGGLEDLLTGLTGLTDLAPAAVTLMHAKADVVLDAIAIVREHFPGPIGAYAETGGWDPPNWVFNGLTPGEYLEYAMAWAGRGAQLIGGCCGVGPGHIQLLASRLPRRSQR